MFSLSRHRAEKPQALEPEHSKAIASGFTSRSQAQHDQDPRFLIGGLKINAQNNTTPTPATIGFEEKFSGPRHSLSHEALSNQGQAPYLNGSMGAHTVDSPTHSPNLAGSSSNPTLRRMPSSARAKIGFGIPGISPAPSSMDELGFPSRSTSQASERYPKSSASPTMRPFRRDSDVSPDDATRPRSRASPSISSIASGSGPLGSPGQWQTQAPGAEVSSYASQPSRVSASSSTGRPVGLGLAENEPREFGSFSSGRSSRDAVSSRFVPRGERSELSLRHKESANLFMSRKNPASASDTNLPAGWHVSSGRRAADMSEPSSRRRPSHDPLFSRKSYGLDEVIRAEEEENNKPPPSAFSRLGRAFRRKAKAAETSETKVNPPLRTPPSSRPSVPPSPQRSQIFDHQDPFEARALQPRGHQQKPPQPPPTLQLQQQLEPHLQKASLQDAPLFVLSSRSGFEQGGSTPADALETMPTADDRPGTRTPTNPRHTFEPHSSSDADTPPTVSKDQKFELGEREQIDRLQRDSPISPATQTPVTPMTHNSGVRHQPHGSIDSTSSSARRRSIAFLASAISMGSISNLDPSVGSKVRSSISSDSPRPSTALGTFSPLTSEPTVSSSSPTESSALRSTSVSSDSVKIQPKSDAFFDPPPSESRNGDEQALLPRGTLEVGGLLEEQGHGSDGASQEAASSDVNRRLSSTGETVDSTSTPRAVKAPLPSISSDRLAAPTSELEGSSKLEKTKSSDSMESSKMSSLFRPKTNRSTGTAGTAKSIKSTSPRTPRRPSASAALPMGPNMGGYVSPFFVAPIHSADAGLRNKASGGRRSSTSSGGSRAGKSGPRSIASDDAKSHRSTHSLSSTSKIKASKEPSHSMSSATSASGNNREIGRHPENRKARSQTNLRLASDEAALDSKRRPSEPSASLQPSRDGESKSRMIASAENSLAPSSTNSDPELRAKAAGLLPSVTTTADPPPREGSTRAPERTPSSARRLFGRRPRTSAADSHGSPFSSSLTPGRSDGDSTRRSRGLSDTAHGGNAGNPGTGLGRIIDSPRSAGSDSSRMEVLKGGDESLRAASAEEKRGASEKDPFVTDKEAAGAKVRHSRGRSSSIGDLDALTRGGGSISAYGKGIRNDPKALRQVSERLEGRSVTSKSLLSSSNQGGEASKIESSGGAAALFGASSRQRTSSLLPSFAFGRGRAGSSAAETPTKTSPNLQASPNWGATKSNDDNKSTSVEDSRSPSPTSSPVTPSSNLNPIAAALAAITAADSASQNALRRRSSFRTSGAARDGLPTTGSEGRGLPTFASLTQDQERKPSRPSMEERASAADSLMSYGNGSTEVLTFSTPGRQSTSSPRTSTSRPSFSRRASNAASASGYESSTSVVKSKKSSSKAFDPWEEETPIDFAERVQKCAPKTQIAAILASSNDSFHSEALSHHMSRFYFTGNPLDIALRKLLMDLHLPKETQQIDRVMEAFAKRYNECNEGLFASDDQPYILAFSLMMLHTDAFNKNAKHKMNKADYLKNTGPSGVPTEILEYLFDNLTFTQFIYVEDEIEIRKRAQEASSVSAAPGSAVFSALAPGGAMGTNNKTKVDPYYLISQGRLGELRPDLYDLIPEDSPYSYTGTLASYEINRLTAAFAYAPSIEIVTSQRPSLPNVGSWAGPEYGSASTSISTPPAEDVVMLKVTKVGIVSRKDDVVDGGKKSQSRKWKTCGLLLTGSQLLLFKDIVWTTALQAQIAEQLGHSQLSRSGSTSSIGAFNQQDAGIVISPRITFFRPDGVISLSNAVAVKDMTYEKYNFVFRLLVSEGRQYLVQAQNEDDMNDWIHKINFCASFRAVNIKIRGTDMTAPQTRSRSGTTNSKALSSEVEYSQRSRKNSLRSPSSAQRLSEDERRRNSLEKRSMGLPSTFHNLGEMEAPLGFEPHSPSWPAVPGLQDDPEQGDDEDEEAIESIASRRRREGEPRNSSSSDIRPRPTSRASTNAPSANSVGLLQRRLAARKALVLEKIQETSVELDRVSGELEEQMRLARHFSVLTPFQRATRERIEAAAVPLSRRIKNLRLELARVESRAKILELDLAACEKLIKEAGPPMTLSSSFIDDARRMPGSQLATPQLLELGRISRSQSGFEDLFGGSTDGYASPATTSGRTSPQNVRSLRMGSLSRASNEKLSISIAAREGNRGTPTRPDGGGPAPLGYFTGGASTSNGRVAGPASTQRYQMALNSVSEQPADESPSMPTTDFAANSSFASSKSGYEDYPTDTGLETDDLTESEADFDFGDGDGGLRRSHSGRARSPIMEDEETLDDEALADMFEPVTLPGKPFANGSPNSARSSASMDAERSTGGEIPERWDQSQLVKEGSNRVSLVFLPTQQELSEATKRLTLGRASGKAPQTSASPP